MISSASPWKRLGAAFIILVGTATTAMAESPKLKERHGDWGVYHYAAGGEKVCFAHSQPKSALPTGVNRDPIHFFVTSRPKAGITNQVSVLIGYPFKPGSKVSVDIDGKRYSLFTQKDGAWVENAAQEGQLIASMRAGNQMVVTGLSKRGTTTTDTYSLRGATKALAQANALCQ